MDLDKQIAKWNEEGNVKKVIDTLEKIKPQDRTMQNAFDLAAAYLQSSNGDWSERKKAQNVVSLLQPIKNGVLINLGSALCELDQYGNAVKYLKEVLETSDSMQIKQTMESIISYCYESMSSPKFKEPFKQRVSNAWKEFEEKAPILENFLNNPSSANIDNSQKQCEEIFSKALSYLRGIYLDKRGEQNQIVILPRDQTLRCFELQYLKNRMPQEVSKNWKLQIGNPPSDDIYLGVNLKGKNNQTENPNINSNSFIFWLEERDGKLFDVYAFCRDWNQFLDHPSLNIS